MYNYTYFIYLNRDSEYATCWYIQAGRQGGAVSGESQSVYINKTVQLSVPMYQWPRECLEPCNMPVSVTDRESQRRDFAFLFYACFTPTHVLLVVVFAGNVVNTMPLHLQVYVSCMPARTPLLCMV